MRTREQEYEDTRGRIAELAASCEGLTPVPACPDWSVHAVLSHVTGVCADILSGNVAGAASDPWTAVQVEARVGVPTEKVLAEWDDVGPKVAATLDDFPEPYGDQVIADLTVHEHDIRGALARAGARDTANVDRALSFLTVNFVTPRCEELGLTPIDQAVDISRFELLRALTGRRSATQIRGYPWRSGNDPDAYFQLFGLGPFTVRSDDLTE